VIRIKPVTMSGQSKGTYSASAAGLSIDSKSGDIDLAASVPGSIPLITTTIMVTVQTQQKQWSL
jgi:hypothetical protein